MPKVFLLLAAVATAAPIPIPVTGSGTWTTWASDSVFEARGGLSGSLDGRSFSMSGVMDWSGAGLTASHHGGGGCTIDGLVFNWPQCSGLFGASTGVGTFTGYAADFHTAIASETLSGDFSYTSDTSDVCRVHGYCTGTWQITQALTVSLAAPPSHMPEPPAVVMVGAGILILGKRMCFSEKRGPR